MVSKVFIFGVFFKYSVNWQETSVSGRENSSIEFLEYTKEGAEWQQIKIPSI